MKEYDVRISDPAEADIEHTFDYLFLRSVIAAENWREGIYQAIKTLETMPQRCSLAPEDYRFDREIRQLWYGSKRSSYRIMFTIFDDPAEDVPFVWVIRVRHHSQQLLLPENPQD